MKSAPDVNLHLPAPNVFIPTDLSLKDVKNKVQISPYLVNYLMCKDSVFM